MGGGVSLMSDNKERILDKIKKCLALSVSSNEFEAEAALRQARKLMDMYDIDDQDILARDASESGAPASANNRPSQWETNLANNIAHAFGCRLVFGWSDKSARTEWLFIGTGASPEIAQYAFSVLFRQIKAARTAHIKTKLKRCIRASKTRRADLFCEGWVEAVSGKITSFAGSEQREDAIDAFVSKNYPTLSTLISRDRNDGRNLRDYEINDFHHGKRSGRDVELNRGIGGSNGDGQLEFRA
jgi:Protein of unknown function (DUF2786)